MDEIKKLIYEDKKSILVLIPIRLGLDSIQKAYLEQVKFHYQISQNVGIAGGKDHMALYLCGYEETNQRKFGFIYLDPHQI